MYLRLAKERAPSPLDPRRGDVDTLILWRALSRWLPANWGEGYKCFTIQSKSRTYHKFSAETQVGVFNGSDVLFYCQTSSVTLRRPKRPRAGAGHSVGLVSTGLTHNRCVVID